MHEKLPDADYSPEMLDDLASMDQSPVLAECEKWGLEQGWDEEYLTGVRESNQLFEKLQELINRKNSLRAEIGKLKEMRKRALQTAEKAGGVRAEGFRRVAGQCKEDIASKRRTLRKLEAEIGEAQAAYAQTANSTMESFNIPAA